MGQHTSKEIEHNASTTQEAERRLSEIYGDLNGDNIINIIDIVILVNIILDIESSYNICYDINSDDSLDILDIIYIIQLIF